MAELSLGTVLGNRFEIEGVLGQGGMATVYLAQDRVRDQKVALKVLHDHLANTSSMRFRLRREVLAAGRIRHPNALVASELHELDGRLALSLPLHAGHTLIDYVAARGPLPLETLEKLGTQLGGALAEAHRHGVVHRDVTPANVMIDAEGNSVLTDFGLARLEDLRSATATSVVGTCGYAAPEVYQGERADPRADLYSLGAVLYLAATGKAPFEAPNPMGVLQRQLHEDLIPLSTARPGLPRWFSATIEAMLHRDVSRRPQGAREVLEAFQLHRSPAELEVEGRKEEAGTAGTSTARENLAADPAGTTAPYFSDSTALTVRPLPAGNWTVIVKERREDREWRRNARRKRRRAQRRRGRGTPAQRAVFELANRIQEGVRALFVLPREVAPEELVARSVAVEAGLPPDALIVPDAMLEREFRLIDGVDPGTAARLVNAAAQAGFKARPLEQKRWPGSPGAEPIRGLPPLSRVLPVLILLYFVGLLPISVLAIVGASLFAAFWLFNGGGWRSLNHLPLAYTRELEPFLVPKYAALPLPSEIPDMPAEGAQSRGSQAQPTPDRKPGSRRPEVREPSGGREASGKAGSSSGDASKAGIGNGAGLGPAPVAPKAPEDRASLMLTRTLTQLDALEKALDDARAELPEIMLDDLRVTLKGLRGQASSLGREAVRILQELRTTDDTASAEAANRIESRLQRLQTLQRAGRAIDAREVADLERGLEAHRKTLEGVEDLESRLTVALARLLEIGSTAAQVRRDLRHERETGGSSVRLVEQLRGEAEAAARALRDVEEGPRERLDLGMQRSVLEVPHPAQPVAVEITAGVGAPDSSSEDEATRAGARQRAAQGLEG